MMSLHLSKKGRERARFVEGLLEKHVAVVCDHGTRSGYIKRLLQIRFDLANHPVRVFVIPLQRLSEARRREYIQKADAFVTPSDRSEILSLAEKSLRLQRDKGAVEYAKNWKLLVTEAGNRPIFPFMVKGGDLVPMHELWWSIAEHLKLVPGHK
ncbi:hypothetical protein KJ765_02620 [Candidatus Micrarchaeota archaeon]|nr:hypothetical protein [Candidatus Micrarchaeota archaeon]